MAFSSPLLKTETNSATRRPTEVSGDLHARRALSGRTPAARRSESRTRARDGPTFMEASFGDSHYAEL